VVTATDNSSSEIAVYQNFTIEVLEKNNAPQFVSEPIVEALQDDIYSYDINIEDEDSVFFEFGYQDSINTKPSWLTLINIDNRSGKATLRGVPNNAQVGEYPIFIRVWDKRQDSLISNQLFLINVINKNDVPEILSTSNTEAYEDYLYSYKLLYNDPDNDIVDVTFNFEGSSNANFLSITEINHDSSFVVISGTPSQESVGNYGITIVAKDNGNPSLSTSQSFNLKIRNVNDKPVFRSSPVTSSYKYQNYEYEILTSDDDNDKVVITAQLSDGSPLPDWLRLIKANEFTGSATLTGTPGANDVGNYDIVIFASDNGSPQLINKQTFRLQVYNINESPSIVSDPITSTVEDEVYEYKIVTNDPDGDEVIIEASLQDTSILPNWLTLTNKNIKSGSASLFGIPENDDVGYYPIKIRAYDNISDSLVVEQYFVLRVINKNDKPVISIIDGSQIYEDKLEIKHFLIQDPDGDDVTVDLKTNLDHNIISINSDTLSVEFLANQEDVGSHILNFNLDDGIANVDHKSTLQVLNTNDAPELLNLPVLNNTIYQGEAFSDTLNFVDQDNDELHFDIYPKGHWLKMKVHSNQIVLSGTPKRTDSTTVFRVTSTDRRDTTLLDFSFNIIRVNNAPVISLPTDSLSINEDEEELLTINFLDPDGDIVNSEITFNAGDLPNWVELISDINSKTLRFTPTQSNVGTHMISIKATDEQNDSKSSTRKLVLHINDVNDAPIFISKAKVEAYTETQYKYDIKFNDVDSDIESLNIGITNRETLPDWIRLSSVNYSDNSAILIGTPGKADIGDYDFTLSLSDGEILTFQKFTLSVFELNKAPTISMNKDYEFIPNLNNIINITLYDPNDDDINLSITDNQGNIIPDFLELRQINDLEYQIFGNPSKADSGIYDLKLQISDDGFPSITEYYEFSIEVMFEVISEVTIKGNYPNPFNPTTVLRFILPKDDNVTIDIFNVLGRRLKTVNIDNLKNGYNEYRFDGSQLSSGIYYYRIRTGTSVDISKFTIAK
jgi:hypothetical protein